MKAKTQAGTSKKHRDRKSAVSIKERSRSLRRTFGSLKEADRLLRDI